jgi:alkylation response protein AidB-like acyl-CoA dehydrogenase
MDLGISDRVKPLINDIQRYIDEFIVPNERVYVEQVEAGGRWCETPVMEEVKEAAKARGLWNFFLPHSERGAGLTNLDYAHIA